MTERKVRVRFAPSPTGALHIGGVRTALYNYLFAKQHGGEFIFRIEDTDSQRFVPGAEEYILETFQWLGIPFNEGVSFGGNYGPYRQSERKDIYKNYVKQLLDNGKAYIAFDTPEQLDAKRAEIPNFQYDASTRLQMTNSLTLSKEEVENRIAAGEQYVVRIKIEPNEEITVHDLIRGDVNVNSSILDDKVLYKSADELPTYHLANIVDDNLMKISHVIRGEEWLPSAPLHVLLYRAFGWEDTMPQFAHLSLLLKPDGNGKLSKRDGDRLGFPVFPLEWRDPKTGDISSGYRESGYLPEAVTNWIALMGWSYDDHTEFFTMEDLIKDFSIDHLNPSPAAINFTKLDYFNGVHIRALPVEDLAHRIKPFFEAKGYHPDDETLLKITPIIQERIVTLDDAPEIAGFFFEDHVTPQTEDLIQKGLTAEKCAEIAEKSYQVLADLPEISPRIGEPEMRALVEELGLKPAQVFGVLRVAVTGRKVSPPLFESMEIIGKDIVLERIKTAAKMLREYQSRNN
ncbi:MAG TPA: glutamate--tRNA ligase [Flexilinea sp.]|nr:glutamate--tRNA ligase [Flexilinea sp.]